MATPTFNEHDQPRKKRIHLSPIFTNSDKNFGNLRFKEFYPPEELVRKFRRSFSLQDLSTHEQATDKVLHESQSLSKITYDDRFIPRPIRDIAAAHDALNGLQDEAEQFIKNQINHLVEGAQEKYENLRDCISDSDTKENRILSFARQAPKGHENGTHKAVEFIRTTIAKPKWKLKRCVPKFPDRNLDCPDLVNDYYLNLLHWGGDNCISIGLGSIVYIWNANTGKINKIDPYVDRDDSSYVSSVQWSGYSSSSCLAVGYSSGELKLFDVKSSKCLRTLGDSTDRIPSLSWHENILTCGSRRGAIINYDVRVQHAKISVLECHTQEVCGLAWSSDGKHLASGGNDNNVYVWEKTGVISNGPVLHNFVSHHAAVKAIAWHPREPNILATGGGTSDHCLNFWNVYNGCHLSSIPTNSQISGIVWNPRVNEFVTSHGSPNNQLTLWSYPSMEMAAHLISHSQRVLSVSLSPDGTTVASVGADETLRLWKCFDPPPKNFNPRRRELEDKIRSTIH
uniref:Cell division cycle protein 20 homolog (Trinotate prediction) n=1 Tax=Henneguya salminicola TaxID=69463 RepID=A0A6G3MEJ4_HENSL